MLHAGASKVTILAVGLALAVVSSCGPPERPKRTLDACAEAYVRLILAIGRHDPLYVDSYYGPPAWKTESDAGAPVPLDDLLARARTLSADLDAADGPADRKRSLAKELIAVETHLRRLRGEKFSLAEECRLLFDAAPRRHPVAEFEAAHRAIDALVPGPGSLPDRIEALRRAVRVPKDRLEAALAAALSAARSANAALIKLPEDERFDTVLVSGKPWSAYNWYQGGYRSRIELNTDLPTELNALLATLCHEGYPGHHVYNVLLEEKLVRGKGWIEYTIYPLFSPQSILAEGTANVGEDILFSDDERRRVLTETLAPIAGLSPAAVLASDRVRDAMRPLRFVREEAARLLLDEGRPEDEVEAFLVRYGLVDADRAKKSIEFTRTYRSYIYNYTLGEDLVRNWIGTGPDRRERYYDLLQRPVVPSDLVRR